MTNATKMLSAHPARPPLYGSKQLAKGSVTVWQVENAVGSGAALVIFLFISQAPFIPMSWHRWGLFLAAGILLFGLLDALVFIPRRYRYYRYTLTADSIIVERGHLWKRRHAYPLSHILYCETRQGPILRLFNLYTVKAATIVDTHAIGPLSRVEATRFEQLIREYPA